MGGQLYPIEAPQYAVFSMSTAVHEKLHYQLYTLKSGGEVKVSTIVETLSSLSYLYSLVQNFVDMLPSMKEDGIFAVRLFDPATVVSVRRFVWLVNRYRDDLLLATHWLSDCSTYEEWDQVCESYKAGLEVAVYAMKKFIDRFGPARPDSKDGAGWSVTDEFYHIVVDPTVDLKRYTWHEEKCKALYFTPRLESKLTPEPVLSTGFTSKVAAMAVLAQLVSRYGKLGDGRTPDDCITCCRVDKQAPLTDMFNVDDAWVAIGNSIKEYASVLKTSNGGVQSVEDLRYVVRSMERWGNLPPRSVGANYTSRYSSY